jgi:hypothetical protein
LNETFSVCICVTPFREGMFERSTLDLKLLRQTFCREEILIDPRRSEHLWNARTRVTNGTESTLGLSVPKFSFFRFANPSEFGHPVFYRAYVLTASSQVVAPKFISGSVPQRGYFPGSTFNRPGFLWPPNVHI